MLEQIQFIMTTTPRSLELDSLIDFNISLIESNLKPMLALIRESRMPINSPDPVTEGLRQLNKLWTLRRLTGESLEKDQMIQDLIDQNAFKITDEELWNMLLGTIQ